jgi:hypothetical protein
VSLESFLWIIPRPLAVFFPAEPRQGSGRAKACRASSNCRPNVLDARGVPESGVIEIGESPPAAGKPLNAPLTVTAWSKCRWTAKTSRESIQWDEEGVPVLEF